MYTANQSNDLDADASRILVIDDSRSSLKAIAAYLGSMNFEVIGAPSGAVGIQRARREQPALILLDVMMPVMDGYATCERLKTDAVTCDIPVIFMTALHDTDNKVRGFAAGAVDYITKPIQYEELLARVTTHLRIHALTRRLESMVAERTRALQETNVALREVIAQHEQAARELIEAREVAERASAAKSRFLTNMNHELRTPLQGILGSASLLLDNELEPDRGLFKTIADAGAMMLSLINNVLDFSKLEFDRVELSPAVVDLGRCITTAIELVAVQAKDKELSLSFDIGSAVPAAVLVDGLRFQQVMVNLLGNAIKFTDAGEVAVRVDAEPLDEDDNEPSDSHEVRVSVADTGIGIPDEHLDTVFHMFHQVDQSPTRRHRGTGIGLALSRKLVELMGGRIWVESSPGQGSTFHFTIRTQTGEGGAASAEREPPDVDAGAGTSRRERGDLRILLAEDNPINLRVALTMLQRSGYDADTVSTGVQVLQQLKDRAYDVILMDVQMPEMDGISATQHIREHVSPDEQPYIIALTANTLPTDRAFYLRSGVDAFLGKPFRGDELSAALEVAAAGRRPVRGTPDDTYDGTYEEAGV